VDDGLAFPERAFAGGAQVAHPLGLTARGDEVAVTVEVEHVDRDVPRRCAGQGR
jgi:hypothetical protein